MSEPSDGPETPEIRVEFTFRGRIVRAWCNGAAFGCVPHRIEPERTLLDPACWLVEVEGGDGPLLGPEYRPDEPLVIAVARIRRWLESTSDDD